MSPHPAGLRPVFISSGASPPLPLPADETAARWVDAGRLGLAVSRRRGSRASARTRRPAHAARKLSRYARIRASTSPPTIHGGPGHMPSGRPGSGAPHPSRRTPRPSRGPAGRHRNLAQDRRRKGDAQRQPAAAEHVNLGGRLGHQRGLRSGRIRIPVANPMPGTIADKYPIRVKDSCTTIWWLFMPCEVWLWWAGSAPSTWSAMKK